MCRNGRRGGLKIPCANNTCGFDPTTGIRSSLESNDSGLLFLFQKTLHRNRLGTLYCHEGDWSWIYFFNGQCANAAGTALWQWLGQQRR